MSDQAAKPAPQLGSFCHVEIAADDLEKAKAFYGGAFGWTFQDVPMGEGQTYVLYQTGGEVGGGIMNPPPGMPKMVVNYILVDDIDAAVAKIEAAGGTIVIPKTEVHGMGEMAHFTDPEGNHMAIWKSAHG